jgi:transposase
MRDDGTHAASEPIATIGIDLGKNTFHLVGMSSGGKIVPRLKVSRDQLERRLANLQPCLIGLEACAGAHHVARKLRQLGHDVRLIPARYVKPFKGQTLHQGAQERLPRRRGDRRGGAAADHAVRPAQE